METEGLRDFYRAYQPRLVGVISLLTGSRAEAEDIVQEAFVRLVPRWQKVSRYDSPEAWVRLVAVRLAANRHRDGNRFRQLFHRLPAEQVADPADGYTGDLEQALAGLPMPTRQAVVLHYVCDLSVAQVADALGIAEGTVKSRLSRARDTLSASLLLRSDDHA
ncbi:SigE family RNA polymerase sigma factor [Kribbella solani]|uniref:RNA polymerase sigma-70 factor (ECF subfamily) n=1 Tax=Kribbella solani TaxID=236067 RepID=A0A841DW49_9ACTN|nr:SigE family RNA polymerase sigma factor [Kribbella solani]MBB5982349.1 RNA polymerase sigma-70 factor (ECF subfamily) [Kribbella solani]MDX2970482.1 SigE family RNA polymerase sigma factor [Kribbella solani]MDX3003771.1 SigE family RNA polymerase sigma factor [Kribbella solani]